jgi:hypothetical protein
MKVTGFQLPVLVATGYPLPVTGNRKLVLESLKLREEEVAFNGCILV